MTSKLVEEMEKEDRRYRQALAEAASRDELQERFEELSNESRRKQHELFDLYWRSSLPTADNMEPVDSL